MRQIISGVAFFQKIPQRFGGGKFTKLEANGSNAGIAYLGDNLMILAIPLLNTLRVFFLGFASGFCWFSEITNNISPKILTLE